VRGVWPPVRVSSVGAMMVIYVVDVMSVAASRAAAVSRNVAPASLASMMASTLSGWMVRPSRLSDCVRLVRRVGRRCACGIWWHVGGGGVEDIGPG
jgi:hypothetical protein